MKISEKIIRLRVTLPFVHETTINTYLIKDKVPTLIESGPGYQITATELFQKLNREEMTPRDILQVVNTHEHPDHFGGNAELFQANPSISFLTSQTAYENFDQISYSPPKEAEKFLGKETVELLEKYAPQFQQAKEIGVKHFLEEGSTLNTGLFRFQIFHLPGHAPGHICLYEPDKKILFSGDNVIGRGTPYIGRTVKDIHDSDGRLPPHGDMGKYLQSLQRLMKLDIETIIPAHGPIGSKARIQETYDRKLSQLERVYQHVKSAGEISLIELTKQVYAHYAIPARLLVGSTSAYLHKLIEDERLETVESETGMLFRVKG